MSIYKFTLKEDFEIIVSDLPINDWRCFFISPWLKMVNQHILIPAGYSWDGCSPKFTLGKFIVGAPDFGNKTKYASLVHDALYQYAGLHPLPKNICDYIFYSIMKDNDFIFADLYYWAVRLCGSYYWNKCVNKNKILSLLG